MEAKILAMTEQNEETLDFVAAAAHELKTPLTAIIVSAELLANELQPDEKSVLDRLIQSIIRNAHSIDERIPVILETGSLIAEYSHFNPERVEIKQVIQNVADQLYPEIQNKRQSLTLEIADALPPAKADRQYLEQILLTIITNASKFTGNEGQITVHANQDIRGLIVRVSDTGIGIPAGEQEQIFQPYYQVNIKTDNPDTETGEAEKPAGNGLGLAIAKFLVELQGGTIWVESTVGIGSSFFFSLPMVVSSESSSN